MNVSSLRHVDSAKPSALARLGATTLAAGFLIAAIGAAWLASVELRTSAAAGAMAIAGSASADAARRDAALADVEAALARGRDTGAMAELAATRALLLSPPDLDAAETSARDALRRSPARARAWMLLAYVHTARDGRLSPAAHDALAQSYLVAPNAGRELRHWRLEFVLSRWDELDAPLRDAALLEAKAATEEASDWWEESEWTWRLADRLPEAPRQALLEAVPAPWWR